MAYKIKIKSVGKDYGGRNTYKIEGSERYLKDVDGKLHTVTNEGEPSSPIRKDIEVIKVK